MDSSSNIERALLSQLRQGKTAEDSPLLCRVLEHNQIILHNYRVEAFKDCRCPLEGCGRSFPIILIPNQTLYPKYCQAHRSEFRREHHAALRGNKSRAESLAAE